VMDGDAPAMRAPDIADWRLAFVPNELASIEDTWDAGGLRRRVAPKEVGVRAARLRRRLTKNPLRRLSFVAAWRPDCGIARSIDPASHGRARLLSLAVDWGPK